PSVCEVRVIGKSQPGQLRQTLQVKDTRIADAAVRQVQTPQLGHAGKVGQGCVLQLQAPEYQGLQLAHPLEVSQAGAADLPALATTGVAVEGQSPQLGQSRQVRQPFVADLPRPRQS